MTFKSKNFGKEFQKFSKKVKLTRENTVKLTHNALQKNQKGFTNKQTIKSKL